MIETVIALLMFWDGEIKEHRIQENMVQCLRGKRTAERQFSAGTKYQCIRTKAELEDNIDGSRSIKKIIIE